MGPLYDSYSSYPEQYYGKLDQLDSEDPGSVQIPQTDFDPLYSDIANYDSEIDAHFLNISELGISQALGNNNENVLQPAFGTEQLQGGSSTTVFAPASRLGNMIEGLDSEPPMPDEFETGFSVQDQIPSSPPPQPASSHMLRDRILENSRIQSAQGAPLQRQQAPQIGRPKNRYPIQHVSSQPQWDQQRMLPSHLQYDPASSILSDQYPVNEQSDFPFSEPPYPAQQVLFSMPEYGDLPSSPPSSPERPLPPRQTALPANLDSLGISHPYGIHRPRSSISRVVDYQQQQQPELEMPMLPGSSPGDIQPSMASPSLVPPMPKQIRSPYMMGSTGQILGGGHRTPNAFGTHGIGSNSNLQRPPPLMVANSYRPELSPALSEASSVSPDPENDAFSWQPVVTVPHSEDSEAIIEQQRKPKQKRKSCLPEGVVDEYVGTTEQEGVHICLFPNCQRLFKRTYNLRSHIQTHLCDRPYVCKVCDANFVRPHDLRRHERCHSNAKPFVCPCGKGFNRQDAMQRHRSREICEGAIHTGIPKSPKPRGRPKGRKSTPNHSPNLGQSLTPGLKQSPNLFQMATPILNHTPVMDHPDSPIFAQAVSLRPATKFES